MHVLYDNLQPALQILPDDGEQILDVTDDMVGLVFPALRGRAALLAKRPLQMTGKLHIRFMVTDIDQRLAPGWAEDRLQTFEATERMRFLLQSGHVIIADHSLEPAVHAMQFKHPEKVF